MFSCFLVLVQPVQLVPVYGFLFSCIRNIVLIFSFNVFSQCLVGLVISCCINSVSLTVSSFLVYNSTELIRDVSWTVEEQVCTGKTELNREPTGLVCSVLVLLSLIHSSERGKMN